MANFAGATQFRASLGIDPAQPIDDLDTATSTVASGLLRPAASQKISGTTINAAPLWMKTNPKDGLLYVYDSLSSAYTVSTTNTVTALSDAGTLSGIGNGMEYYDNYMYFATGTDITRYGPLNGTPGFTINYWTSTLGKAALTNTTYPASFKNLINLPNHVMCRHSDGKMYFTDVVGNQGAIHYIATTKTTVEGDTNNSSTASKLTFGYGLWPTCIESFGSFIAVGLIEATSTNKRDPKAKLALWDTTSSTFNQIIWVEFPDPLITAIKNVNGALYIVSGGYNGRGFRVSKYLGGYSFQEVYYSETGEPCLPGAIESIGSQLIFGTHTTIPASDGCVYSVGLQKAKLGGGIFNIMRATGGNSSTSVTALAMFANGSNTPLEFGFNNPTIGWTNGSGTSANGLDQQQTQYNNAPSIWWSQMYKIGQPFYLKRIKIPLSQAVAANMTITPTVYYDDGISSQSFTVINSTNFPNGERYINLRTNGSGNNVQGFNNFWLELKWTGSALLTVNLPIQIEFETFPD